MDNQEEQPTPKAVIHLEADLGSSIFDIHIENCDPIQLLGCAEMLHAQGMMALAGQQAAQAQMDNRNRLVTADHLPPRRN